MKPLRIAIIESQEDLIEPLKEHYSKIFMAAGYSPEFFGGTREADARKIIDKHSPHCVICDLTFGRKNDGLLILRNMIIDFPDVFHICASRGEYSPRDVYSKNAEFPLFFDKGEILAENDTYIKRIAKSFRERFRLNTSIQLDPTGSVSEDFKSSADRREFLSLLSQVTFTDHDSDQQLTPDSVRLTPLSGGFSGSKVYKFESYNLKSTIPSVPAVLKVSKRERAEEELRNYNRFVKWGLPYTWRVDVLGSGFTKKFGAVAYSFVLSGTSEIQPLTELLRNGDFQRAKDAIDKIFSPDMRRWYGDQLIETEANINRRYSGRYFRGGRSASYICRCVPENLRRAIRVELCRGGVRCSRTQVHGAHLSAIWCAERPLSIVHLSWGSK
jgi:hypothetical protein